MCSWARGLVSLSWVSGRYLPGPFTMARLSPYTAFLAANLESLCRAMKRAWWLLRFNTSDSEFMLYHLPNPLSYVSHSTV